ncbi:MAG: hypothetical protein ACR2GF_05915 [Acidimicrobiales bacterium]
MGLLDRPEFDRWPGAELADRRARQTDPIVGDAYGVGVVVYGRLPD